MYAKHSPASIELAVLSVQLLKGCGNCQCTNIYCVSAKSSKSFTGPFQTEQDSSLQTSQQIVNYAKHLLNTVGTDAICRPSVRHILLMWRHGIRNAVRDADPESAFSAAVFPNRPYNHLIWSVNFQEPSSETRAFLEHYVPVLLAYPRPILNHLFDLRKLIGLIHTLCPVSDGVDGIAHFFLDGCLTLHEAYLNYTLFQEIILLQYDKCNDPFPILHFIQQFADLLKAALNTIALQPSTVYADAHLFFVILVLLSIERFMNLSQRLVDAVASAIHAIMVYPDMHCRLLVKLRMFLNSLPLATAEATVETLVRLCNMAISDSLHTLLSQKPNAAIKNADAYSFTPDIHFPRLIGVDHYTMHPVDSPMFWAQDASTKYQYEVAKLSLTDILDNGRMFAHLCDLVTLLYQCNNLTTERFPVISLAILHDPTKIQQLFNYIHKQQDLAPYIHYINSLINYNQLSSSIYTMVVSSKYVDDCTLCTILDGLLAAMTQDNGNNHVLTNITADIAHTAHMESVSILPDSHFVNNFLCSSAYDWNIDAQFGAIVFDPDYSAVEAKSALGKLMGADCQYLYRGLDDVNTDVVTATLDVDISALDYLLDQEITRQKKHLGPKCYAWLQSDPSRNPLTKKATTLKIVDGSAVSVPRTTATLEAADSLHTSAYYHILDTLHGAIPRAPKPDKNKKDEIKVGGRNIRQTTFTFLAYPCLLDVQTKLLILRYELGYMIRASKQSSFLTLNTERSTLVGDFLAYFMSFVSENLVDDWIGPAYRLILRRPLRAQFSGEEALDFGGPSRELFSQLLPQFIQEHASFFTCNRCSNWYYINWNRIRSYTSHDPYFLTRGHAPFNRDQQQYMYELRNLFCQLGAILGMALVNNVTVTPVFPSTFYRLLLGGTHMSITGSNLNEVDTEMYHSLMNLHRSSSEEKNNCHLGFDGLGAVVTEIVDEELELLGYKEHVRGLPYFSDFLLQESFPPNTILTDLKAMVQNLHCGLTYPHEIELWSVTAETLPLFIRLKQIACTYNKCIIDFIRTGFFSIAKARHLSLFTASDLELALTGEAEIDFAALSYLTIYEEPYSASHIVIQNFWLVVADFTHQQQRSLLQFITGSDRVPAGGMQNVKLKIIANGADDMRLPIAHTCFNILCLPAYSSISVMRDRLLYAINNCRDFGLR